MSWIWISAVIAGVMLVIILVQWIFIARHMRKRRSPLSEIGMIEAERKFLDQILDSTESVRLGELFRHRASLLGRLMIGEIVGDGRENDSVMEEIAKLVEEREEFMYQNRLLYEHWQPEMARRFRDAGLNDKEIEICCLYALGLNGKTIQQYTRDSRHYQNVGIIRKKLGLGEHDRNIDGYIKSLMK